MLRFWAVWVMLFGTTAIADDITLFCAPTMESDSNYYVKFNDEKQKIKLSFDNDFTYIDDAIVVQWSDTVIIFVSVPIWRRTNEDFNESMSVLDRVSGRLQTVYASYLYVNDEVAKVYHNKCELFDELKKPKF